MIHGDALAVLTELPTAAFDAVITDPPYSSGGFTRSDRTQAPATKYVQSGQDKEWVTFSGDNRDARSWAYWCYMWLSECSRVLKPGGYVLLFIDWRQLPTMTDALQAGGFVWRGVVPWDKGLGSRAPHKGYFRHQCEYVVWGTNGPCEVPPVDDPRGGPWPGCFQVPVVQADKFHMTGKPTALMRQLVRVAPPGGLILDPFAGSFTTAIAAAHEGRRCVAVEKEGPYVEIGRKRVDQALDRAPGSLLCDPQQGATAGLFDGLDADDPAADPEAA